MAEDLTDYYQNLDVRCRYLHSDIDTLERFDIIRELRMGKFDVLIGINLLREGLDIPEVSLVAIMDADKEGFLRGERALIQTCGRAARNLRGKVILYADTMTRSMKTAIDETNRRRKIQGDFNIENHITPASIIKNIQTIRESVYEQDYVTVATDLEEETKILKEGKLPKLLEKLRKDMRRAAEDLEFEKAAAIRDHIKELEQLKLALG
jgi:excinuclease ABC subunit B